VANLNKMVEFGGILFSHTHIIVDIAIDENGDPFSSMASGQGVGEKMFFLGPKAGGWYIIYHHLPRKSIQTYSK